MSQHSVIYSPEWSYEVVDARGVVLSSSKRRAEAVTAAKRGYYFVRAVGLRANGYVTYDPHKISDNFPQKGRARERHARTVGDP